MGQYKSERFDNKHDYDYLTKRYQDLKANYPYLDDKSIATRLSVSPRIISIIRERLGLKTIPQKSIAKARDCDACRKQYCDCEKAIANWKKSRQEG